MLKMHNGRVSWGWAALHIARCPMNFSLAASEGYAGEKIK